MYYHIYSLAAFGVLLFMVIWELIDLSDRRWRKRNWPHRTAHEALVSQGYKVEATRSRWWVILLKIVGYGLACSVLSVLVLLVLIGWLGSKMP